MIELGVIDGLFRGIVVGLIVAAPLGPVNLIVIQRTMARGWTNGMLSGQGAALGDAAFAMMAAFGMTALTGLIDQFQTPIEAVGGAVLIGMGIRTFLAEPEHASTEDPKLGLVKAFFMSFILTITNPATLLAFVAIFAGVGGLVNLAAAGEHNYAYATMLVGGVWLGSTLWWLFITTVAGFLRDKADQKWLDRVHHGSGAAIILFGGAVFLKVFGVIDF